MVALPNPAPPPRPLCGRAEIEAAHRLLHEEHARLLLLPSPTFLDLGRLQVVANMLQPLCWLRALKARGREAEQAVASAKAAAKTARRLQIEAERALSLAIDLDGPRASRLARMRELFAATQATAEAFRAARQSWQLARLARLKAAEQLRSALAGWFERLPLIERMTGAEPKPKGAKANG